MAPVRAASQLCDVFSRKEQGVSWGGGSVPLSAPTAIMFPEHLRLQVNPLLQIKLSNCCRLCFTEDDPQVSGV